MVIAKAFPNFEYRYAANFRNIILEARYVGERVMYYEVNIKTKKEICLRQELVHDLFHTVSSLLSERPFIKKGNREFWIVLHRHQVQYKDAFKILVDSVGKPETKLVRTKPLTRTRKP